jgi:hypothetical protein
MADLDIDPPTLARRLLQDDYFQVLLLELQRRLTMRIADLRHAPLCSHRLDNFCGLGVTVQSPLKPLLQPWME